MALEILLDDIKAVNGYVACGIMTFTGDMLVHHCADQAVDIEFVGALFNDIFRSAHKASKDVGLQAASDVLIKSADGTILMHCSGVDAPAHLHFVSILRADGNRVLMERAMDRTVPKAVAEFS